MHGSSSITLLCFWNTYMFCLGTLYVACLVYACTSMNLGVDPRPDFATLSPEIAREVWTPATHDARIGKSYILSPIDYNEFLSLSWAIYGTLFQVFCPSAYHHHHSLALYKCYDIHCVTYPWCQFNCLGMPSPKVLKYIRLVWHNFLLCITSFQISQTSLSSHFSPK